MQDQAPPKRTIIDQHTSVTVGLVIALVGGIFFLANMSFKTQANAEAITKIRSKQDTYNQNVQTIMLQMAEIKGQIQLLNNQAAGGQKARNTAQ